LSREQEDKLKEKVRLFPEEPGVYLMKDGRGRIVYVGKAKRLSARVRSYFRKRETLDLKTQKLVSSIRDLDYIVTRNELEALVLECNLIKEYRPKYNIQLKDDKKYPYIKLTNETFPRLLLVRSVQKDGAEYFGPYTDVKAVRRILRFMKTVFTLRNCAGGRFLERERECLNFQIDRCPGPCTGRVDEKAYGEIVNEVRLYLRGRSEELRRLLEDRMAKLAESRRYEEAARIRDQLGNLERMSQRQLAVNVGMGDRDVVALARELEMACGVVMKIREGKLLGVESFLVPVSPDDTDSLIYDNFFKMYYHSAADVPGRILTQETLEERTLIEEWLTGKRGARVRLSCPVRGEQRRLMELARKNASLKIIADARPEQRSKEVLAELKRVVGLIATPFRIEVFDISNIQGAEAVGSMVTFKNVDPLKSAYRHFKIREVEGVDDFAMLSEVIKRRARHISEGRDRAPDLIMVDGGRGQVSAARKALHETELSSIPVIGLAKREEEIYTEGASLPIRLPRSSKVLRLLQRMRDEAHRFAIEYHRKLRSKRLERSELDDIQGIGETRKIKLLIEFGSVEALRRASVEDMASINGIGGSIAAKVYEHFHGKQG
jgi:excinuclease ABC subunit C